MIAAKWGWVVDTVCLRKPQVKPQTYQCEYKQRLFPRDIDLLNLIGDKCALVIYHGDGLSTDGCGVMIQKVLFNISLSYYTLCVYHIVFVWAFRVVLYGCLCEWSMGFMVLFSNWDGYCGVQFNGPTAWQQYWRKALACLHEWHVDEERI